MKGRRHGATLHAAVRMYSVILRVDLEVSLRMGTDGADLRRGGLGEPGVHIRPLIVLP